MVKILSKSIALFLKGIYQELLANNNN